jgi:Ion channel
LLGLLFSAAHGFAAALISNYLDGVNGEPTQSDTLYFSLITLTTVGYGDITPAANVARAVAAAEAITGQLYLVSVVAAVVSRYQSSRHARVKASDPGKEDPTDSHVPDSPGTHDGDDATT